MTALDPEIFRSANLFLELHGDDAVAKARDIVRAMQERGDNDCADRWLRIIVETEAVQRGDNPADSPADDRHRSGTPAAFVRSRD